MFALRVHGCAEVVARHPPGAALSPLCQDRAFALAAVALRGEVRAGNHASASAGGRSRARDTLSQQLSSERRSALAVEERSRPFFSRLPRAPGSRRGVQVLEFSPAFAEDAEVCVAAAAENGRAPAAPPTRQGTATVESK